MFCGISSIPAATEIASSAVDGAPTIYGLSPELPADATTTVPALVRFLTASVYRIFGLP